MPHNWFDKVERQLLDHQSSHNVLGGLPVFAFKYDWLCNTISANGLVYGPGASMAAMVGAANQNLGVTAGGGTAIQFDGNNCFADNLAILGFRNGIVCVPKTISAAGCGRVPRFGWIRGDVANLIRIDKNNDSGEIAGKIKFGNDLTSSLGNATDTAADYSFTDDMAGGTNIAYTASAAAPVGGAVVGMELTIGLSSPTGSTGSTITSGGPIYNSNNVGNLNPAGAITNRFTAVITAVTSPLVGTLNLPNMPTTAFFDASATLGATAIGNINATSTQLTITSTTSGTLSPGHWISGGLGTSTVLSPGCFISSPGTVTGLPNNLVTLYTLSIAPTVTILGGTFTTQPGAIVTAAISGATLTASGTLSGSLTVGQQVLGPGILAGTSITATSSSGTSFAVNAPQAVGQEVLQVVPSQSMGSISGTTLTLTGPLYGTAALSTGQMITGSGLAIGTVLGSLVSGSSTQYTLTGGGSQLISNELLSFASGSVLTGTVNNTTLTVTAGAPASGLVLSSPNLQPNSFIAGPSGSNWSVNVFQSVGSNLAPLVFTSIGGPATIANSAALLLATIGGSSTSSTLNITENALAGTFSNGQLLLGPGIPANTTLSGVTSTTATLSTVVGTTTTPQFLLAYTGAAIQGSISKGVLTVTSSTSATSLSIGPPIIGGATLPGSYVSSLTATGPIGLNSYGISVGQNIAASTTLSIMESTRFLGSIASGTLSIAPSGTFASGQTVFIPQYASLNSETVAATVLASAVGTTSTNATYTLTAGSSLRNGTYAINATNITAAVIGSIGLASSPAAALVVTTSLFGTLSAGQELSATGVTGPLYVTGTGTTVGATTVYPLSNAGSTASEVITASLPQSATFSGTINGTILTVTTVSAGGLATGQSIVVPPGYFPASTAPIYIMSYGAQTWGGTGTYILSQSTTGTTPLSTTTLMSSFGPSLSVIGTITGSTGSTLTVPLYPSLTQSPYLTGPGILSILRIGGGSGSTYPLFPGYQSPTIGSRTAPISITATRDIGAASTSTVLGSILGNTLTVSFSATTTLNPGQVASGVGVLPGTTIVGVISASSSSGTYLVDVLQNSSSGPLSVVASGAVVSGSISGTTLTAGSLNGTLVAGQVLVSPGNISLGSYLAAATNSGGTATGTIAVPQYASSSQIDALTMNLLVGSITGISLGYNAISPLGSSLSVGQIISAANVVPGTSLATLGLGMSGTVLTPQIVASQTVTTLSPIPISAFTTAANQIVSAAISGLGARPGRVIEINQASQMSINHVETYAAGTSIKAINCGNVQVNDLNYDTNQIDMNSTVFDIQGGAGKFLINGASSIAHFLYLNNNSETSAQGSADALRLIGNHASVQPGGTLINHQGARLIVSGSDMNHGTIAIGSATTAASFSATDFAPGSNSGTSPTTFVYALNAPQATFDPSCQNVPGYASALFNSSSTVLASALTTAIGGQSGSDLGRSGYVVFPSDGNFTARPGDRQLGRISLGITTTGTSPGRMTTDGMPVILGTGANSLPMPAVTRTYCQGTLLAYRDNQNWAFWPQVSFLLGSVGGTTTLTNVNTAGTPATGNSAGSGSSWSISFTADVSNKCLSATGTATGASSLTTNWLLGLDCLDVGM
jgi:hypothetical protein